MVSCTENLCRSFLECISYQISYVSFELVGVFRIFQFVFVLVGKVPLELIYICVFNGCHASCVNNSESVIWVSVFVSAVFTFEHGISESDKDLKFECRRVNDLRHSRPNGQQ